MFCNVFTRLPENTNLSLYDVICRGKNTVFDNIDYIFQSEDEKKTETEPKLWEKHVEVCPPPADCPVHCPPVSFHQATLIVTKEPGETGEEDTVLIDLELTVDPGEKVIRLLPYYPYYHTTNHTIILYRHIVDPEPNAHPGGG